MGERKSYREAQRRESFESEQRLIVRRALMEGDRSDQPRGGGDGLLLTATLTTANTGDPRGAQVLF